jgi:hypothetical protein
VKLLFVLVLLATSLAGCKDSCSTGVQKDQTNPLEGDRPGVCKEK